MASTIINSDFKAWKTGSKHRPYKFSTASKLGNISQNMTVSTADQTKKDLSVTESKPLSVAPESFRLQDPSPRFCSPVKKPVNSKLFIPCKPVGSSTKVQKRIEGLEEQLVKME